MGFAGIGALLERAYAAGDAAAESGLPETPWIAAEALYWAAGEIQRTCTTCRGAGKCDHGQGIERCRTCKSNVDMLRARAEAVRK